MVRTKTLQQLFQRYRKPGDLVFAIFFLVFSVALLTQLGDQTKWVARKSLFVQPRFWPAVAVGGMVLFGTLHLIGSLWSPRIYGRLKEMWFWARSLEYVAWFLILRLSRANHRLSADHSGVFGAAGSACWVSRQQDAVGGGGRVRSIHRHPFQGPASGEDPRWCHLRAPPRWHTCLHADLYVRPTWTSFSQASRFWPVGM